MNGIYVAAFKQVSTIHYQKGQILTKWMIHTI